MSNENHAPVKEKDKQIALRFEVELKESTDSDSYLHLDYLELTRSHKVRDYINSVR